MVDDSELPIQRKSISSKSIFQNEQGKNRIYFIMERKSIFSTLNVIAQNKNILRYLTNNFDGIFNNKKPKIGLIAI